jgi:hypothetical protein
MGPPPGFAGEQGPAVPKEPDSPFTLKDDGAGNAFTDGAPPPQVLPCFWITPEGFIAGQKRQTGAIPLVTTTNRPSSLNSVGAVGQVGTVPLFTTGDLNHGVLGGGRLTTGLDIQDYCPWLLPMEFSIFYLSQTNNNFSQTSDSNGNPVLARPVFASQIASETAFLSSFPNLAAGAVNVSSSTRFWGFDYDLICRTNRGDCRQCADNFCNFDFLFGFRYANLAEAVQIASSATPFDPGFGLFFNGSGFGPGNTALVNDSFSTQNVFRGGQVGGRVSVQKGALTATLTGKLGIGVVEQTVDINGYSTLMGSAGQLTVPGGLLAVPSNSGHFSQNKFAVLPEGNLILGWQISDCLRLQAGYNILYVSSVVRPGDAIGRTVDTRQVPTDISFNPQAPRVSVPGFSFHTTDYWTQGVTLGVTLTY